jgi:hypothetical protein
MPNTFELIASSTVGSGGAASIDFSSIPSTYTDLVVKLCGRGTSAAINAEVRVTFNGSSASNYSWRQVQGNSSVASSTNFSSQSYVRVGYVPDTSATSNTFNNLEFYVPNYAGSTAKSLSSDSTQENNTTAGGEAIMQLIAGLWSLTSAITQVTLSLSSGNFAQHSTAYLYGVKNA